MRHVCRVMLRSPARRRGATVNLVTRQGCWFVIGRGAVCARGGLGALPLGRADQASQQPAEVVEDAVLVRAAAGSASGRTTAGRGALG